MKPLILIVLLGMLAGCKRGLDLNDPADRIVACLGTAVLEYNNANSKEEKEAADRLALNCIHRIAEIEKRQRKPQ